MLEIRVHQNHGFAPGHTQSGEHGGFFTEIAAERGVTDPWIASREFAQSLSCPVAAAVVHIADLKRLPGRFEGGHQCRMKGPDHLALIETGYDD